MSLRFQLLLLQLAIVVVTVCTVGVVATLMQAAQIRDSYQQRMIGVAQSVATLPSVRDAFDSADPAARIQPIAELIRQSSGVTYVVVTDDRGVRYSHPDPERIGHRVSTDPSVPLSGDTYVGTQTGTLGRSWRVKVPVRDRGGEIIGTASVGTLEQELRAELLDDLPALIAWLVGAVVLGTLGAVYVSRVVWRRIYRLEPEEIAALLETRDAMLHGIGEGVVAVDDRERIALVNDEAVRLLGIPADCEGRAAEDVLEPGLTALLRADEVAGGGQLVLAGERVLVAQRNQALVESRPVGVVLILRDRTELHTVLRDLDGARDLTQALRAQAHEFSNRMHIISGLIELGRTDDAMEFISRTGKGGALTKGSVARAVEDPDLVALLLAKITTGEERGVEVRVDPESSAMSDGTADLVTIVGNLIDNAVDATGPGGAVDVAVRHSTDAVTVTVADDGPGVPEAERERIFDAGVSTKGPAGASSRGIGLALVTRIVERRGGSVQVQRAASGGARFVVRLPHAPETSPLADRTGSRSGA